MLTIINFKTYEESTAEKGLNLARELEAAAHEHSLNLILAPQAVDMKYISDDTDLFLIGQHCDESELGQSTGHITTHALKLAGASGSILNHSENRLDKEKLSKTVTKLKADGFLTIVCVQSVEEGLEVEKMDPDYIAFEPPAFIGSETSVVDGDKKELEEFFAKIKSPTIIGAGIKSKHDIQVAEELGAAGILIASHIVKADSPSDKIKELLVSE